MKVELLAKLLPKSANMESVGSKNHNAITPEDINIIMSYCGLNDKEAAMILVRFLGDNSRRSELYNSFYRDAATLFENEKFNNKEKTIKNIVDCAFLEAACTTCPFCGGVGHIISLNKVEKCNHCNDGVFVFDDDAKRNLTGLKGKDYKKIQKGYKEIMYMIQELESSALSKIDDT
jgi:hypothetical protein